jgi:peptide alpha-N-acetyltransferase
VRVIDIHGIRINVPFLNYPQKVMPIDIMPISLRRVKISDFFPMQNTNLHCLAENYHMWYWLYHYLLSPQAAHVAFSATGKIIGYVLGKIDDENQTPTGKGPVLPHGHITSVAVYSCYRKLGIATRLLRYTHYTLKECFHADHVDLNVRETNRAAHILYNRTLGYEFVMTEEKYYADGENGWVLRYTYPKDPPNPS